MTEQRDRRIRPFSEWLTEHRGGVLHAELGEALNTLAEAVKDLGKGGSLLLSIAVKPATRGGDMTVVVEDLVTVKLPQPDRPSSLFFVDDEFNLVRQNPHQQELFPRAVPRPEAEEEAK